MSVIRAAGLDWSASPRNRALAVLEVTGGRNEIRLCSVSTGVSDDDVASTCNRSDLTIVAIDVPDELCPVHVGLNVGGRDVDG